MSSTILSSSSSQLHELSVVAAAAIKDGSLTSVASAAALLRRYHDHVDLDAFITVNDDPILEESSYGFRSHSGQTARATPRPPR
jgi:hypothetical protein